MFHSKDGLFNIDIVKNISDQVLPAADFSVFNIPLDKVEAKLLFNNIKKVPTAKHLTLMMCRHKKADQLQGFNNISTFGPILSFSDTIHISYDTTLHRGHGFSALAETAFLFYKEAPPNYENTGWYRDSFSNASNFWDTSPYKSDADRKDKSESTVFSKFAWDVGLLMLTSCQPLEHKSFIWALDPNDVNMFHFCKTFSVKVYTYVESVDNAEKILKLYEEVTSSCVS